MGAQNNKTMSIPILELGRVLLRVGLLIAAVGGLLLLAARWNLPLGRLPGDLHWRGRNTEVWAPLATSLLLSALLSLALYLLGRLRR